LTRRSGSPATPIVGPEILGNREDQTSSIRKTSRIRSALGRPPQRKGHVLPEPILPARPPAWAGPMRITGYRHPVFLQRAVRYDHCRIRHPAVRPLILVASSRAFPPPRQAEASPIFPGSGPWKPGSFAIFSIWNPRFRGIGGCVVAKSEEEVPSRAGDYHVFLAFESPGRIA